MKFGSDLEMLELIPRVMTDNEPSRLVDTAYLFHQLSKNEESVLDKGQQLFREKKVGSLTILGEGKDTNTTFSPKVESAKLTKRRVPSEYIITTTIQELAHTHTEAIAFVDLAKTLGWTTVYIVSTAVHQLRAFAEVVTTILRTPDLTLKAYSIIGAPLSWTEFAKHSQGDKVAKPRHQLFQDELERIENYYNQGDLVSAREILEYLNKRDI